MFGLGLGGSGLGGSGLVGLFYVDHNVSRSGVSAGGE